MTQPQAIREDAERWIDIADQLPEYVSRDDFPCNISGKAIPPTLASKTVLVALTGGGVRTDKFIAIEGSPGWWYTYGKRVTHWMPTPALPEPKV